MNAELITIGDELLIGQVTNTNASYIGEKLCDVGIKLRRVTTIGDDETAIHDALQKAWNENDVVITTGGLGPTHDDITKKVITKFFNTKLILDENILSDLKNFFEKRERTLLAVHEEQAFIPECAIALQNQNGTAPGLLIEKDGKSIFVLPGVPVEMKSLMQNSVIPYLQNKSQRIIKSLTLKTTGIFESTLSDTLRDIPPLLETDSLAFLPSSTGVRMRITVESDSDFNAEKKLQFIIKKIRSKIGDYIYSESDDELEDIICTMLTERSKTLAAAESCTGGLIGHRITNVSGSSKYFIRDIVAYSNETKIDLLKVDPKLIQLYGAVSSEAALVMAENVRKLSQASIGISTTGIAGPTGGTPTKPVGLVWIGYSDEKESCAYKFLFGDNRLRTKERAAQTALEIIRRKLLGLPIKLY